MRLYESIVVSSVAHCLAIWGLRYPELIERIQVTFIKKLLLVPKNTPDFALRLETGLIHLKYLIFKLAFSWFIKLHSINEQRLPRICFEGLQVLEDSTDLKLV